MIAMIAPNGVPVFVHESRVEKRKAAGFRLAAPPVKKTRKQTPKTAKK